jgi:hypothetical protein
VATSAAFVIVIDVAVIFVVVVVVVAVVVCSSDGGGGGGRSPPPLGSVPAVHRHHLSSLGWQLGQDVALEATHHHGVTQQRIQLQQTSSARGIRARGPLGARRDVLEVAVVSGELALVCA